MGLYIFNVKYLIKWFLLLTIILVQFYAIQYFMGKQMPILPEHLVSLPLFVRIPAVRANFISVFSLYSNITSDLDTLRLTYEVFCDSIDPYGEFTQISTLHLTLIFTLLLYLYFFKKRHILSKFSYVRQSGVFFMSEFIATVSSNFSSGTIYQ